jgi:hypothetical protein
MKVTEVFPIEKQDCVSLKLNHAAGNQEEPFSYLVAINTHRATQHHHKRWARRGRSNEEGKAKL